MSQPFPPDLPDLLRVAAKRGKVRLYLQYASTEAEGGRWEAAIANSGEGWTVEHHPDFLEAMHRVLVTKCGPQLAHLRGTDPAFKLPDDDGITPEDIEQAVIDVLGSGDKALPFSLAHVAEAIAEKLFPVERPKVHAVENVRLGDMAGDDFDSLIGDDDLESLL